MKKGITLFLILNIFCYSSCGSKKHTKCDAYGNKSGKVKIEQEAQA